MVSYRDCGEKKLKFDNWSQTFTEITFKGECIAAQGVCGCLCVCVGGGVSVELLMEGAVTSPI